MAVDVAVTISGVTICIGDKTVVELALDDEACIGSIVAIGVDTEVEVAIGVDVAIDVGV